MKLLCCFCLVATMALYCEAAAYAKPVPRAWPQNNAVSFLEGVVAGEVLEAEQQAGGYGGGYNSGYGNGYGYNSGGYNNGYNYGR